MKLFASTRLRLFVACWVIYALFFATNVVREHYPAFALIERGDWVCDRYWGMHSDLFRHTDGHVYTGNNALGSLIAVPPLLVLDPLLDRLEAYSQRKLTESPEAPEVEYDTRYPNRREMFRRVKLAGLELRFGASTAITSWLLMAPLSAFTVLLVFDFLRRRGLERSRALWLAFLFAFATPVFYRTAHLNHNMFLMEALFGAFLLLWPHPPDARPLRLARRLGAGFLCGLAFALDYAGALPVLVLTAYLVVPRAKQAGWAASLREALPFVLAGLPGLAFLLGTQWAMYGDPLAPGQFVMNAVNFTDRGVKGIGFPSLEVFVKNLLSPSWGLLAFSPFLVLGFVPARYPESSLLFPRAERRWSALFVLVFLLFCAANWYSLMQFNSGFRYLLPVVPFLFLAASDHLARMPKRWLVALAVASFAHMGVLCMYREVSDTEKELLDRAAELGVAQTEVPGYWTALLTETAVPRSWRELLHQGPQLPWLTVMRQTATGPQRLLGNPWLPTILLALTALALAALWRAGERSRRAPDRPAGPG